MAIIFSLVWGLSFGLDYGVSNHNTYLLHGLRMMKPTVLANDWLASQTIDYHPFFSYVAYVLLQFSESGWGFAIANVAAVSLAGLIIFGILRSITNRELSMPVFIGLITLLSLTHTQSVSVSYIFSGLFQPSTIGALGFIGAVLLFVRGSYLYSGAAVAIGGLFHANYLVLSFPVFILAHILLARSIRIQDIGAQLVLPSVFLLPFLPTMLAVGGAKEAGDAANILINIRSPHHYAPLFFYRGFIPFLGWVLMGLPCLMRLFVKDNNSSSPFRAILTGMTVIVVSVSVMTSIFYIPKLAQIYVWRLAPYIELMMQMAILVIVAGFLVKPSVSKPFTRTENLFIAAGFVAIMAHFVAKQIFSIPIFMLCLAGLVTLRFRTTALRYHEIAPRVVIPILIALWLVGGAWSVTAAIAKSAIVRGLPQPERELYDWAKSTAANSRFLIPPDLENFRLHAERPIVVDWKSTPIVPSDLVEWYRRIEDISGVSQVGSLDEALEGYLAMDDERLKRLATQYVLDYVVLYVDRRTDALAGHPVVFENQKLFVIRIR